MNSLKYCLWPGLGIFALVLLSAPALRGAGEKGDAANWENLRNVAPSSSVRVVLKNVGTHQGKLRGVSDESLTISTAAGKKTFARNEVLRVSTKGKSHRVRNLLIGMGVGAVTGVIVGVADPELGQGTCAQGSCVDAGTAALVGFGGAVAGTAVGAIIPTGGWHEVFRAPPEAAAQPGSDNIAPASADRSSRLAAGQVAHR